MVSDVWVYIDGLSPVRSQGITRLIVNQTLKNFIWIQKVFI